MDKKYTLKEAKELYLQGNLKLYKIKIHELNKVLNYIRNNNTIQLRKFFCKTLPFLEEYEIDSLFDNHLYFIDFSNLELNHINFSNIVFTCCNFNKSMCAFTNFTNCAFGNTTFDDSNCGYANFTGANFYDITFKDVYFRDALFYNNWFSCCEFISGNFNAHFYNVRFDSSVVNLDYIKKYIPMVCPETGSFIGYKKALISIDTKEGWKTERVIVKLQIPEDARRSSATTRKCRADKAIVLEVQDLEGNIINIEVVIRSLFNPRFAYSVGDTLIEPNFDTNRFNECAAGIHFFITRQEAVDYNF